MRGRSLVGVRGCIPQGRVAVGSSPAGHAGRRLAARPWHCGWIGALLAAALVAPAEAAAQPPERTEAYVRLGWVSPRTVTPLPPGDGEIRLAPSPSVGFALERGVTPTWLLRGAVDMGFTDGEIRVEGQECEEWTDVHLFGSCRSRGASGLLTHGHLAVARRAGPARIVLGGGARLLRMSSDDVCLVIAVRCFRAGAVHGRAGRTAIVMGAVGLERRVLGAHLVLELAGTAGRLAGHTEREVMLTLGVPLRPQRRDAP